jgi:hypothetical protein
VREILKQDGANDEEAEDEDLEDEAAMGSNTN